MLAAGRSRRWLRRMPPTGGGAPAERRSSRWRRSSGLRNRCARVSVCVFGGGSRVGRELGAGEAGEGVGWVFCMPRNRQVGGCSSSRGSGGLSSRRTLVAGSCTYCSMLLCLDAEGVGASSPPNRTVTLSVTLSACCCCRSRRSRRLSGSACATATKQVRAGWGGVGRGAGRREVLGMDVTA